MEAQQLNEQSPSNQVGGGGLVEPPGSPLVPLDPSRFREMVEKQQVTTGGANQPHFHVLPASHYRFSPPRTPCSQLQTPGMPPQPGVGGPRFWVQQNQMPSMTPPGSMIPTSDSFPPMNRPSVQRMVVPASSGRPGIVGTQHQTEMYPGVAPSPVSKSSLGSPTAVPPMSPYAPHPSSSPVVSAPPPNFPPHFQQQQQSMMYAQQQPQFPQQQHYPYGGQWSSGQGGAGQLSPGYGPSTPSRTPLGSPLPQQPIRMPPNRMATLPSPVSPRYYPPQGHANQYPSPGLMSPPPQRYPPQHQQSFPGYPPGQYGQGPSPQYYSYMGSGQGGHPRFSQAMEVNRMPFSPPPPPPSGQRPLAPPQSPGYPHPHGSVQYPGGGFSPGSYPRTMGQPVRFQPGHYSPRGDAPPRLQFMSPQPGHGYQPNQFFGHDPNISFPADMCLVGCVFLIVDYDRLLDQKEIGDWRLVIAHHGGEVESLYTDRCTHLICESIRHPVVQQALKEGKRCVTAQWLNDCVQHRRMQPPWKAAHFPTNYSDCRPCKNKLFTVTNFDDNEKLCLKQMICAVGGRFTEYLCKQHDFVIAKIRDGRKVVQATEWKIPVLNVLWLSELCLGFHNAVQNWNNAKYQFFGVQADPFQVDALFIEHGSTFIHALMNPWRVPVQVAQETWQTAVERKERIDNDDGKIFPFKKLRLSPAPDDVCLETRKQELDAGDGPVVCFTGFYPAETENLAKKAIWLGATVTESVEPATHLVCCDLKRTQKLLKAVALGKWVVQPSWIRQSFKQGHFLDGFDFIVKDEGNEKFFGFNLKLSLCQARQKKVFQDVLFYLSPSLVPGPSALKELVQCAGGRVLMQRPLCKAVAEYVEKGVQFVAVSCETDVHLCQSLVECGVAVHSVEFILTGIIRQELDFVSFQIEPPAPNPNLVRH